MSGIFGPNGSLIESPSSIQARTQRLVPAYATLNKSLMRELGAAPMSYSTPQVMNGAAPEGLGFVFGQSWARTQSGVMEFSLPNGQVANMEMALRFACENAFIGKAMRFKTQLATTGIKNCSASDKANNFFDQVHRELGVHEIYRMSMWLYFTVGMAPILLPDPGEPLSWIQLLDPRMVRTMRAYGKTYMYVVIDRRMVDAYNDRKGLVDPRNKDYWDSLPASWKKQIAKRAEARGSVDRYIWTGGEELIKLEPGSYVCLQNRYNSIDRKPESFDGIPLQPYFSAATQFRMGLAAQFAASFLAKNLIALVSVGDPKAEGENYVRPDDSVLSGYRSIFNNPNQAQWVFADATTNVRYITPDKEAWASEQLAESKEQLKNLLPSPFWYNDGGGSYASATVEMKQLVQEIEAANDDFDRNFWLPLHERAAEGRAIAKKNLKVPLHDRDALKDEIADLQAKSAAYNNGALDVYSLMEAHGYDPDVIVERLRQQKKAAGEKIFMPAFEQKQGIVAGEIYDLSANQEAWMPPKGADSEPNGRPPKPGSPPQVERTTGKQPRPKVK